MLSLKQFIGRPALVGFAAVATAIQSVAQLPSFDLTRHDVVQGWHAQHHIKGLRPTPEGLAVEISGADPYFVGPASEFPADMPLWLVMRLKAPRAGDGQVFFFRPGTDPVEERSAHFGVRGGDWEEVRVPLPPLDSPSHFRVDPPGDRGTVVVAGLRFEKRITLPPPKWPAWTVPAARPETILSSGELELRPGVPNPGGFEIRVAGNSMAFAHPNPLLAYVIHDEVRWVAIPPDSIKSSLEGKNWLFGVRFRDPDGATWELERRFTADSPGAIQTETRVKVDRDRAIAFLPLHLLFAGEQSFGKRKGQGMFAGLEYLDDEPSSSEADIEGPESKRQVPAPHKITFPLMAIQAGGRYVGLTWEPDQQLSAVFDSPDRLFGSGGHAMGIVFPGASAGQRAEGDLMPYFGKVLPAGRQLISRAWLLGGRGDTVVPAVQQYVRLRGMPTMPDNGLAFQDYVSLAAKGWLDSKCREGNLYRHAFWPGFHPTPAADAALFEAWLAAHTTNAALSAQLQQEATNALSAVKPAQMYHANIGHVQTPAPVLVVGRVNQSVAAARRQAQQLLTRFESDGTIPYYRSPNHPDYGRTHSSRDANGLTAEVVATALESAAFCGDTNLIAQALVKLRALAKFRGTVPRGAQTWEVPLHTPDILAAAYLVKAYTLGHELTGEKQFLDDAIYWAWTGVPFVYLVNPTGQRVGPFSTIAVLGATNWKAPVWFGRPVQWCGLVYADALRQLAKHDASSTWTNLADGIISAGLQHMWRADDVERVGLLPDYYELLIQQSAGPAINPATIGVGAPAFFGQRPIVDRRIIREAGLIVHAPAEIHPVLSSTDRISFEIAEGWWSGACSVLITGFSAMPTISVNNLPARPIDYDPSNGSLVLQLDGRSLVEVRR